MTNIGNRTLSGSRLAALAFVAAIAAWSGRAHAGSDQVSAQTKPGSNVEELLALVKTFNPDLAASALESEEATAMIVPAGALDDPAFNVMRDEGFRQTLFSVSQDFPLWGKRDLRKEVAQANATAAKDREGGVAKDLEEQVKAVFAQYFEIEHAIRVTREIRSLLQTVTASARARYAQGLASQSDAIRAELEQTRLDPELTRLARDDATAKAKINALIAHPASAELAEPAALRPVPAAASLVLAELLARARDHNPMLAAAHDEIAAAEGERKLVEKSYYPDVTVTLGGDDLPDQSTRLTAGVGVKIPLQWDVREAQAHAANVKKAAMQSRFDGSMLKIESELKSDLETLRAAEQTRDLLKNTLSQQSEAAYRSALASYERGRGDLTPILEAARAQLEIRRELLRIDTEAQTALAAIERLVGEDL